MHAYREHFAQLAIKYADFNTQILRYLENIFSTDSPIHITHRSCAFVIQKKSRLTATKRTIKFARCESYLTVTTFIVPFRKVQVDIP